MGLTKSVRTAINKNSPCTWCSRTCLPVLQFHTRKVSSSAAVTTVSPLSSNVIPVICLGTLFERCATGMVGGVGLSMAFLKILAGLYLDYRKTSQFSGMWLWLTRTMS